MKMYAPLLLALSLAVGPSAAVAQTQTTERSSVVVTTEVLGSIVVDLAGDAAEVTVLMSGGVDPHSWQPSARDSQALFEADFIVANGLDLEEGLTSVLGQAEADGLPIFHATDHVSIRASAGADEHAEDEADHADEADAESDHGHDHDAGDPHFWLDPLAMREVVLALGDAMTEAGIDVADRYGFRIVGTVIPGLSSSDEPSARDIAELIESIREAGTTALFSDVGTPPSVAEAVAAEAGAQLVELRVAQLPESGRYADLLRDIATAVAGALGA